MSRHTITILVTLSLVCSQIINLEVKAEEGDEYRASISRIAGEIATISENLNANRKLLKTEQDRLLEAEQELSRLQSQLRKNAAAIDNKQANIAQLNITLTEAKTAQKEQKNALSRLLLARYKQGDVDHLQKILNQQNPYAVGRLNHYHQYFSQALKTRYVALEEEIQKTQDLHTSLQQAISELVIEREKKTLLSKQLSNTKEQRAKSVAKLSAKVGDSSEKLDRLKKDRARLNSLLEQIAKQAAELQRLEQQRAEERTKREETNKTINKPVKRTPVLGGFKKQKGRLSYPLASKARVRFGARLAESGMRSDGIYFATNKSTPVKTIFRGRVLFADFLKGYGLLIIIDHGDDHISLYGHNELLYKRVGDTVETGDVIAKTGVTGGLRSPGLYFEIRDNTEPVDPALWCQ